MWTARPAGRARRRQSGAVHQAARTVLALARACHPAPALTVTALAAALAAGVGRPVAGVVLLAAAMLADQLSVGWLNDLLDADRDAQVGRAGKPVAAGEVPRRVVAVAVVVAGVAAIALTLPFGPAATLAHLVALASAWGYDLGLKATAASVLPYAVSFGLLPAIVTLGEPGSPWPPAWLMAAAATLGCAAHFANVIPDLDDDLATGVRGLPHRVGARVAAHVAAVLVLTTAVLLVLGPPGPPSVVGLAAVPAAAVVLAVGLVLGRRDGSRAPFGAVLVVALVDAGFAVAAIG